MKRILVLMSTAVVPGLTGSAGSAEATGPTHTPNGHCGALNMVAAWPGFGVQNPNGVGVQPGGGMERAMTIETPNGNDDNPNGNDDMSTAVEASDCS